VVAPPHCVTCGDSISFERKTCGKCEKSKTQLSSIRTSYWLSETAQSVLHEIKFRSDYPTLSFLTTSHLTSIKLPNIPNDTWIIPIPLTQKSFFERGFNQSEIMAQKLATFNDYKMIPNALIKVRKTERQSWLTIKERQTNLKGAFVWNDNFAPPESVLLVDDVYTTGSTIKECAKVLRKVKVKNIHAWTLFRTPKKPITG